MPTADQIPGLRGRLAAIADGLKREVAYYRRVVAHPETPLLARWLLIVAIGYALLPFDLIPDFLPVIGHLDDLIVVPGLVLLAIKLVPQHVKDTCRSD